MQSKTYTSLAEVNGIAAQTCVCVYVYVYVEVVQIEISAMG